MSFLVLLSVRGVGSCVGASDKQRVRWNHEASRINETHYDGPLQAVDRLSRTRRILSTGGRENASPSKSALL